MYALRNHASSCIEAMQAGNGSAAAAAAASGGPADAVSIDVAAPAQLTDTPEDPCSAPPQLTLTDLPPELFRAVARLLRPNEVATSLRLTCRFARDLLTDLTTVQLSQPVPCHAFTAHWGRPGAMRRLTRRQRRRLLSLTAVTGVAANVRVLSQGVKGPEQEGLAGTYGVANPYTRAQTRSPHTSQACLPSASHSGLNINPRPDPHGGCAGQGGRRGRPGHVPAPA
jgi:hypothetical protein